MQVSTFPQAVAVSAGAVELTYVQLDERANRLANHLRALGAGPETAIGICLECGPELPIAVLAVWKAGACYLALDPEQPVERLDFMLHDARAPILITQAAILNRMPVSGRLAVLLDADGPEIAAASSAMPESGVTPGNLAYLIYTSGTTGRPKGVALPHRGLASLAAGLGRFIGGAPGMRMLQFAPFGFDAATLELAIALSSGATLVTPQRAAIMPGRYLEETLDRERVNAAILPPSAVATLRPEAAAGLSTLIVGGEALSIPLAAAWSPGRRLFNAYGPTETTICVTIAGPLAGPSKPPIGFPLEQVRAHVLDSFGNPLPAGVPGELYLGGPGVGRGYVNAPDLTASYFVPDPFSTAPGERMYRTGDLVRWRADGQLDFIGRVDRQIKIRGCRMEPDEIAARLREHLEVCAAAVVLDPSGAWLAAYVVLREGPGREAVVTELRTHLQRSVPAHMLPSRIVALDRLPLTARGKVDYQALRELAAEPEMRSRYEAEATPTEQILCGMWESVLNIPAVGLNDDFFELGGHSLLAAQVVARIQERLAVEVPLRAMFEKSTVRELARAIEDLRRTADGRSETPPLASAGPREIVPLSFAQQRLWFLDQMHPGSGFYNCPLTVRLRGVLDAAALKRALELLLERHDVLRLRVETRQGEAVGIVDPPRELRLSIEAVASAEAVETLAREEAERGFDLAAGPLVRARLLGVTESEYVLLVNLHHMVCDAWSLGLLMKELVRLYAGERLDNIRLRYADWAEWQREWLHGERLQRALAYWRRQLAGAPERIEWRIGKVRPAVQTYRGARVRWQWDEELSRRLRAWCRAEGVTLHMVLVAAVGVLLWRVNGQSDLVIGTVSAGRTRRELEPVVGLFLNLLPLRVRVDAGESFESLVARVREVALEAYAHQELPFEKLVEELAPERALSHHPLFQTLVVVQNAPSEAVELRGLHASWGERTARRRSTS